MWGRGAKPGATRRLADSFRIGRVILLPFDVRLHIGGWHKPHIMAKRANLAGPEVRRRTGLQSNQAGSKVTQKIQDGRPAKLPAKDNLALRIHTVKLEHRLGQIDPDGCNIHVGRLLPIVGS